MSRKNNNQHCFIDDLNCDLCSLSKAARIEEYEEKLLVGEEPDLKRLLTGLKNSEKSDVLTNLKLSKLLVNEGKSRREEATRLLGSRWLAQQKESLLLQIEERTTDLKEHEND